MLAPSGRSGGMSRPMPAALSGPVPSATTTSGSLGRQPVADDQAPRRSRAPATRSRAARRPRRSRAPGSTSAIARSRARRRAVRRPGETAERAERQRQRRDQRRVRRELARLQHEERHRPQRQRRQQRGARAQQAAPRPVHRQQRAHGRQRDRQARAQLARAQEADPERGQQHRQRVAAGVLAARRRVEQVVRARDVARLLGQLQLPGVPETETREARQAEQRRRTRAPTTRAARAALHASRRATKPREGCDAGAVAGASVGTDGRLLSDARLRGPSWRRHRRRCRRCRRRHRRPCRYRRHQRCRRCRRRRCRARRRRRRRRRRRCRPPHRRCRPSHRRCHPWCRRCRCCWCRRSPRTTASLAANESPSSALVARVGVAVRRRRSRSRRWSCKRRPSATRSTQVPPEQRRASMQGAVRAAGRAASPLGRADGDAGACSSRSSCRVAQTSPGFPHGWSTALGDRGRAEPLVADARLSRAVVFDRAVRRRLTSPLPWNT